MTVRFDFQNKILNNKNLSDMNFQRIDEFVLSNYANDIRNT